MTTVDGYIRVSKVRGRSGDSFISPSVQRERIEAFAKFRGFVIGEMYEELDESGSRADRPRLLEAVERIEAGLSGGLVVAKLDRFGRSLVDGLATIERIQAANGIFASVAEQFDTTTPHGRLVLRMMLSLAEFELDRVVENFADARARAVARGIHPCPVPPAGYLRREDGGLKPDPEAVATISELFRRAAAGESWASLARFAESQGLLTAYGSAHWEPRAIKDLVRKRVYLGIAHHGEFENAAAHEPLVDPATWERAQRTGRVSAPRSSARPSLLAGILRCAGCQYVMPSFFDRHGARWFRCTRKHATGLCVSPTSTSTRSGIEEVIVSEFFRHIEGMPPAKGVLDDAEDLDVLRSAVAQATVVVERYRDDARLLATLGSASYHEGLERHVRALNEAQSALDYRLAESNVIALPSQTLRGLWSEMTTHEKRLALTHVFDAVFLSAGPGRGDIRNRLHFFPRGTAPEDMPRRGGRGRSAPRPIALVHPAC